MNLGWKISLPLVAFYRLVIRALKKKKDNWASQLDPIGSIGFAIFTNRRTNFARRRDKTVRASTS
jgi:hypothetical protein